jgi:glycosyltransferase involved in cell wall biosynthesis
MKLLIINYVFPEPDKNAGAHRLVEIVKLLLAHGHEITFLAQLDLDGDPKYPARLEELGVKCICDTHAFCRCPEKLGEFLQQEDFDVAIVAHYDTYNDYASVLRENLPGCRLIFDTVDLHFVRLQREADLLSDPDKARAALKVRNDEIKAICHADSVWVVTEAECQFLVAEGLAKRNAVHVIPTIHTSADRVRDFLEREGIVFLGGYGHPPNVDAVKHFMAEILPRVRKLLPEARITIAGSDPPEEFKRYEDLDSRVFVAGFVEDHRSLLEAHRIGIAPLRFGAGMKGKIGEYLACGLPCVTTTIGAEGMNLTDGVNVVVANRADVFALAIVQIYTDPARWRSLSQSGLAYINQRVSPLAVARLVGAAVSDGRPTRGRRPRAILRTWLRRFDRRTETMQLLFGCLDFVKRGYRRIRRIMGGRIRRITGGFKVLSAPDQPTGPAKLMFGNRSPPDPTPRSV